MEVIKTKDDFEKASALSMKGFLIVHFFGAHWSPESTQMEEVIKEVANDKDYAKTKFFRIEAEDLEEISLQYNVTSVPAFLFLLGKASEEKLQGADPPKFLQKVQELQKLAETACLGDGASTTTPAQHSDNMKEHLEALVSKAPIMLFMKGTPQEPRCGFSRKAVDILNKYNVKYESYDILSNNEVREGLKKFSNWPSYPQLYLVGALIGGVDIMNQLHEDGDLERLLREAETSVTTNLSKRLKLLTTQDDVMIFMKGDPENPRCGFSRKLISIMNETGVPYATFDVLSDEQVREGLKKFSDWPTYPQLYVRGELIGGVDIVTELKEAGDLVAKLKGEV